MAKKSTSKKTATKKSGSKKKVSRKVSKKRSPPKIKYTKEEQTCIDYVQAQIKENFPKIKAGEFKHIAQVVAVSYNQMREKHGDCAPFYDREKVRKDKLKAERRAAKKSRKSAKRRTNKGSKRRSKKRSPASSFGSDTESL